MENVDVASNVLLFCTVNSTQGKTLTELNVSEVWVSERMWVHQCG